MQLAVSTSAGNVQHGAIPSPPIQTACNRAGFYVLQKPIPPENSRPKGSRVFSMQEKTILECNYARNKFPVRAHFGILGSVMGKSKEQTRRWYNKRRALDRKKHIDVERKSAEEEASPGLLASAAPLARGQGSEEQSILLPSEVFAYNHVPGQYEFTTEEVNAITAALGCSSAALPTMHEIKPSMINWILPPVAGDDQ